MSMIKFMIVKKVIKSVKLYVNACYKNGVLLVLGDLGITKL